MVERIEISQLREYSQPHRLALAEFNALARAALMESPVSGFEKKHSRYEFVGFNLTGVRIPAYSVFGVSGYTEQDGTPRVNIEKIGIDKAGSHLVICTNGPIEIGVAGQASVYSVNFDEPVLIRVNSAKEPQPGLPCGVNLDSFTIEKDRLGLVCLSDSISAPDKECVVTSVWEWNDGWDKLSTTAETCLDCTIDFCACTPEEPEFEGTTEGQTVNTTCVNTAPSTDKLVWVLRATEPIRITGCVASNIGKYTKTDTTKTFGSGTINVRYRSGTAEESLPALNPSTGGEWKFVTVYNAHDTIYPIGMLVTATHTLGVGFVVDYSPPNTLCSGESETLDPVDRSGGCCCKELKCLNIDGVPETVEIKPEYYEFTPTELLCNCVPPEDAQRTVHLYQVDPEDDTIWEQKHGIDDNPYQCYGTASGTVDCIVTATWIWVLNEDCGNCTWQRQPGPGGWPTDVLVDTNCSPGCECDTPPSVFDPEHPPLDGSGNFSLPCLPTEGDTGHWELVGTDDPECDCIPEEPDFEGTSEGQEATTSCASTKVVEGEEEILLVSFWRLTIVEELDYYGCDQSKLEFIIGS